MTNREWITEKLKKASDHEVARIFCLAHDCQNCPAREKPCMGMESVVKWLNKEHKEGKEGD